LSHPPSLPQWQSPRLIHAISPHAVEPAGRVAGLEPIQSLFAVAQNFLALPTAGGEGKFVEFSRHVFFFDFGGVLPFFQSCLDNCTPRLETPFRAIEFAAEIHIAATALQIKR